jgi:hypothetical protein
MLEVGLPLLLWSFPPNATVTSFPVPDCWACATAPAFSSWLVRDFPFPPMVLRVPSPLCYVSFLLLLLIIRFFFLFSLGGVQFVHGAMLICPRVVCGIYHMLLSSPCGLSLPKLSGHCHLAVAWEPSWFLCLMWSGDAMHRLEVWRSHSFAFSWWFFL